MEKYFAGARENKEALKYVALFLSFCVAFYLAYYFLTLRGSLSLLKNLIALILGAIFFFAGRILLLIGYAPLQISVVNLSGAYLVNFNLVPLVALAIATPGWGLRERGKMLAIGIPLLFLLRVLDLVAHFPMYFYGSEIARMMVYSIGVGGVATPFIIWLALNLFLGRKALPKEP